MSHAACVWPLQSRGPVAWGAHCTDRLEHWLVPSPSKTKAWSPGPGSTGLGGGAVGRRVRGQLSPRSACASPLFEPPPLLILCVRPPPAWGPGSHPSTWRLPAVTPAERPPSGRPGPNDHPRGCFLVPPPLPAASLPRNRPPVTPRVREAHSFSEEHDWCLGKKGAAWRGMTPQEMGTDPDGRSWPGNPRMPAEPRKLGQIPSRGLGGN